jgi:heavy metal sensor kinase
VITLRPRRVRTRLTLWYVFVLGCVLAVYIAAVSVVLLWQIRAQLNRQTIQDLETVEGLLSFGGDGRLHFHESTHPESRQVQERLLEVLAPDGTILFRNDRLGNRTIGGAPFPGEGQGGHSERSERASDGTPIVLASGQHSLQGRMVLIRVAYSLDPVWARLQGTLLILFLALPLALVAAGYAGYKMADRALQPIDTMARRAEQITSDRLNERLPVENPEDEIGRLASVFNATLSRLEHSFDQLRRFTADASHELRTPLAALRSVGEVGLQKDATAEEYRETIGSMLEEVNQLTQLVESLMTLSRADASEIVLRISTFPILEIMREAVALLEVLAEEKHLTVTVAGDENTYVEGDRLFLRQAVINILHNAVKFTPSGGAISVRACCEGPRVALSIIDSGPGISAEQSTRVFERFYRVDQARSGQNRGTGLGLAIARWAVEANHGQIGIVSAPGTGCTFWVNLPAAPPVART